MFLVNGFILTNEGSITHTNSDGLVDKIVCVPSTGDYTKDYVNPNNVNIGFIQDLDATKVAIIQSVASNFDKQASDSIFTQKMDFLKATNPDEWKKVYEGYETANISDTKGFSFDPVNVEAEIAAMDAVWESYYAELITGTVDPDETMKAMKKQMEDIGIEKVQKEAQSQLDEYLKSR